MSCVSNVYEDYRSTFINPPQFFFLKIWQINEFGRLSKTGLLQSLMKCVTTVQCTCTLQRCTVQPVKAHSMYLCSYTTACTALRTRHLYRVMLQNNVYKVDP